MMCLLHRAAWMSLGVGVRVVLSSPLFRRRLTVREMPPDQPRVSSGLHALVASFAVGGVTREGCSCPLLRRFQCHILYAFVFVLSTRAGGGGHL
ncbi:hypothetical protein K431DRAFT_168549 [Polychaeton citri CBS 116435]|uniref:Secreted protein n=1 Tax=Polychaeton citri CBS 116435 TaxID=1314669 RepID=A0A9P4Q2M7_9PEZI|nr:hypothetical protein K431DRAFT_168549 [Polychaeton citri CBS 116435]